MGFPGCIAIAIMGDIHANLEALEAVLEHADKHYPGIELYSTGDIVGYGANPKECLDIVRDRFEDIAQGNHDAAVGMDGDIPNTVLNGSGVDIALDHRGKLDDSDREFLRGLGDISVLAHNPLEEEKGPIIIAHGFPADRDKYVKQPYGIFEKLRRINGMKGFENTYVVVNGHTHVSRFWGSFEARMGPVVFGSRNDILERGLGNGNSEIYVGAEYIVEDLLDRVLPLPRDEILGFGNFFMINAGSVGQPRDKDRRAGYIVLSENKGKLGVTFHRVEYDNMKAAQKIRDAGYDARQADRLLPDPIE